MSAQLKVKVATRQTDLIVDAGVDPRNDSAHATTTSTASIANRGPQMRTSRRLQNCRSPIEPVLSRFSRRPVVTRNPPSTRKITTPRLPLLNRPVAGPRLSRKPAGMSTHT